MWPFTKKNHQGTQGIFKDKLGPAVVRACGKKIEVSDVPKVIAGATTLDLHLFFIFKVVFHGDDTVMVNDVDAFKSYEEQLFEVVRPLDSFIRFKGIENVSAGMAVNRLLKVLGPKRMKELCLLAYDMEEQQLFLYG